MLTFHPFEVKVLIGEYCSNVLIEDKKSIEAKNFHPDRNHNKKMSTFLVIIKRQHVLQYVWVRNDSKFTLGAGFSLAAPIRLEACLRNK